MDRDVELTSDDNFTIVLDTFDAKRSERKEKNWNADFAD